MQKENNEPSENQPERSHWVNIFSIIAEAMPASIQIILKQIDKFASMLDAGTNSTWQ